MKKSSSSAAEIALRLKHAQLRPAPAAPAGHGFSDLIDQWETEPDWDTLTEDQQRRILAGESVATVTAKPPDPPAK